MAMTELFSGDVGLEVVDDVVSGVGVVGATAETGEDFIGAYCVSDVFRKVATCNDLDFGI